MPVPERLQPDEASGYTAPVRRALVEIPLILGVPRHWALVWIGACMMTFFIIPLGLLNALLLMGGIWVAGQAALALLTRRDPQWPELAALLLSEPDVYDA
jgi:type IV secretory pathway TrbD component